jgi:hypothetical protein
LLLVIPFREPGEYFWYGESPRGRLVTESLIAWVMTNAETNFAEGRAVNEVLRVVQDWQREDIALEEWLRLTGSLEVKYILEGQIEELSLVKPQTIGILDPWVRASYRVIDVERGRTVWQRNGFVVTLGRGRETDAPIGSLGADKVDIERKLLAKLGADIGQDLYGYEEAFSYND